MRKSERSLLRFMQGKLMSTDARAQPAAHAAWKELHDLIDQWLGVCA